MRSESTTVIARARRAPRGVATLYLIVAMMALIGFCSLAVDLGRVQVAKTELHRGVDAAAIYACQGIADGSYVSRAVTAAGENFVDGQPLVLLPSDVTLGTWSAGTFTAGGASPNAIQIVAVRSKARGTAIPLIFAQWIGQSTCDVRAKATALFSQQTVTPYIPATSNPWLAGEPTGTSASVQDPAYKGPQVNPEHPWSLDIAGPNGGQAASGQPYNSPIQVAINLTQGSLISLYNVTGTATNDPTLQMANANGYQVDGDPTGVYDDEAAEASGQEHGMSNLTAPLNGIIGVFLNDNVPDTDSGPQPATLDFSTQAERDYTQISPQLRQPFYIGNGQNSSGTQQQIVIPPGATRFFLATMDGHEWSNNVGGFNAAITQTAITLVE